MLRKRTLCIIISILMILSVLPFGASAAGVQNSENVYASDVSIQSEKSTIYFCNNRGWENVYIYGFYGEIGKSATGEPLGMYPGTPMEYKMTNDYGHDIYALEISADIDFIKFCDGTDLNNRTDNISKDKFSDGTIFVLGEKNTKYWSYETAEYIIGQPENENEKEDATENHGIVHFVADYRWGNIYAYCYGGDGEVLGAWPGTRCKYGGNSNWWVELTGKPEEIIFHSYGDIYQTSGIPFEGFNKKAIFTGEWTNVYGKMVAQAKFVPYDYIPDNSDSETAISGKLYFKDSRRWGNIYAFTYNDTTLNLALGAWPGTPCKYEGNDIWSVEVPEEPEGVLFNSPISGNQTEDIIFTGYDTTAVLTGIGYGNRWEAEFVSDFVDPEIPDVPELPDVPEIPDVPELPEIPDVPEIPDIPETPETGVCVDGKVYDVNVGDTLTYEVWVEADRLFEDVQAYIYYDGSKLTTEGVTYYRNNGNGTNCPNLKYVAFNSKKENVVKFNASYINGMDFRDGKVLVTLDFIVVDNSYSEIRFDVEEMTIKGDGTESYFTNNVPVVTEGITVTQEVKVKRDPNVTLKAQVNVNDKLYDVKVGSTLTYEVWVEADRLFEDFQAYVRYDSTKLKTESKVYSGSEGKNTNCPNLKGFIYNSSNTGAVKVVSSYINGMDFSKEKVLVTIDFEVINAGYSEIKLDIEEMTIKGDGTESYFADSKAVITEGIKVTQKLKGGKDAGAKPKAEICVDNTLYKTIAGDTITYEVWVEADELLENVQAIVNYDVNNLELITVKGYEACPALVNGLIFNSSKPGIVRFNASCFDGYNFTEGKALVTMKFRVKNSNYSEIKLDIEEMTITGDGSRSYFTGGKPDIIEGVVVTQSLKGGKDFEIASANYVLGDANGDNKVNVKDATEIQKATAGLVTFVKVAELSADVDANEKVNVRDATAIQKGVAGLDASLPIGKMLVA